MSEEPKQQKGVNRREWLKSAATGAVDCLFLVPSVVIGAQYRREIVDFLTDAQHNSNEYIERTREFIKAQYGIEVTFGPDHQKRDEYRMEGLSEDEARTVLSALLITLYLLHSISTRSISLRRIHSLLFVLERTYSFREKIRCFLVRPCLCRLQDLLLASQKRW